MSLPKSEYVLFAGDTLCGAVLGDAHVCIGMAVVYRRVSGLSRNCCDLCLQSVGGDGGLGRAAPRPKPPSPPTVKLPRTLSTIPQRSRLRHSASRAGDRYDIDGWYTLPRLRTHHCLHPIRLVDWRSHLRS